MLHNFALGTNIVT